MLQSGIQSAADSSRQQQQQRRTQDLAELQRTATRKDLEQQLPRRWKVGNVYAPHDLSGVEMSKWKRSRRKPKSKRDALDDLGLNPLKEYKVCSLMP